VKPQNKQSKSKQKLEFIIGLNRWKIMEDDGST
jgi:hypothetical protein